MKTEAKSEGGSGVRAVESNGTQTADNISDRDLKILSLQFIGECNGTYYFRDETNPTGPAYSGTMADLKEHLDVKSVHPMIDAGTAAAVLEMRRLGRTAVKTYGLALDNSDWARQARAERPSPFGTAAGDQVAS